MSRPVPEDIKLYHIVHLDRLPAIIQDGFLWCDAVVQQKSSSGTTIGLNSIKERRLKLPLTSYPNLYVGECVPFYFCPRSVMLFMFYKDNNHDITYHEGQEPIIHLVADLRQVVEWASRKEKRWVFTDTNAGSFYFNDFNDLAHLDKIDWQAVQAMYWQNCRENKQAEFLLENQLPFELIESIGVCSAKQLYNVQEIISLSGHKTPVKIMTNWYY